VSCNASTPNECNTIDGKACVNLQTDPQYCGNCTTQCSGGQTCSGGTCKAACSPGLNSCSNSCVDEQSDPNNCGACGNTCPSILNANNHCSLGGCKTTCDTGLSACVVNSFTGLTACVNLQKDPTHCGACGTACSASQVCDSGTCKSYIPASGCWECGDGNPMPLCCSLAGQTICTNASACP
jgi:hypothetical protein